MKTTKIILVVLSVTAVLSVQLVGMEVVPLAVKRDSFGSWEVRGKTTNKEKLVDQIIEKIFEQAPKNRWSNAYENEKALDLLQRFKVLLLTISEVTLKKMLDNRQEISDWQTWLCAYVSYPLGEVVGSLREDFEDDQEHIDFGNLVVALHDLITPRKAVNGYSSPLNDLTKSNRF